VEANSKLSTTRSLSYIGGPGAAGVLVQVLGAPVALLADALSFVASAVAVATVRVRESPPPPSERKASERAHQDCSKRARHDAEPPGLITQRVMNR